MSNNEPFEREMIETRRRISIWGAPYSFVASGVVIGLSAATLTFLLLMTEQRNWLLLCALAGLIIVSINSIHLTFQRLNRGEGGRD